MLGVDTPAARLPAEQRRLFDENDGRIRLAQAEDGDAAVGKAQKGGDVKRPAPAQVAGRDEAANEGSAERTDKDGQRVQRDGHPAIGVVVDICQHPRHDGELARAAQAGEEATDDQRLDILGHGRCDGEDAPDQHGYRQWPFPPSQL